MAFQNAQNNFQYDFDDDDAQIVDNTANNELSEQWGFDEPQNDTIDLFELKNMPLQNFPKQTEKIKNFAISEQQVIIITESNQIWRWRIFQEDEGFQMFSLPKIKEEGNLFDGLIKGAAKMVGAKSKKNQEEVERVFIDPRGFHVILSSLHGENYYFHIEEKQIRHLTKIRYVTIKSIGWLNTATETCTQEFLIGTDEGVIIIWYLSLPNLEERMPVEQLQLSVKKPIQNLKIIVFEQEKIGKSVLVIASTSSIIYCFHGSSELKFLFQKYQQDQNKLQKAQVPMPPNPYSIMDIAYDKDQRPSNFIWTNGTFISHYTFPGRKDVIDINFIRNQQALRYAKKVDISDDNNPYQVAEMPIGIGLSEYHYYLLHGEGLTIVSRISETVVTYYDLQSMGRLIGMIYDTDNEAFWIYSDKQVKKLNIVNENKNAWKLYLTKKNYDLAYEICKQYDNEYRQYIGQLYADYLFQAERYEDAAVMYFETQRSFEQIFLKFITHKQDKKDELRAGLEKYLKLWLQKLQTIDEDYLEHQRLKGNINPNDSEADFQNPATKHLKTIVISWLVELKVYKMNVTDRHTNWVIKEFNQNDDGSAAKLTAIQQKRKDQITNLQKKQAKNTKEFNNFLRDNILKQQDDSVTQLVYEILQSHGRLQNCIDFAKEKGSYDTIIKHHINEENYTEAIHYMELLKDNPAKFEEILLSYCHIFMQHQPSSIIRVLTESKLIQQKSSNFNFTKLIGGLMNIQQSERGTEGVKFLNYCIKKMDPKDKMYVNMNNILIFFLTEPLQPEALTQHLQEQEECMRQHERCSFDLDYALRLFKRTNFTSEAQVCIYGMMGLYAEAVNLALQKHHITLAKEKAKLPENNEIKKKLQIQIAVHLLGRGSGNIKEVIQLTKDPDSQIKIEDLLLHFNENIKIEHFKDEICESLRDYSEIIEDLKSQMEQYSKNAEQLKNEARMIKNRCIEIDSQHKCEECLRNMFTEEFYIFPCMHGFHKECLIQNIRESVMDQSKMLEIEMYSQEINELIQKANRANRNDRNDGSQEVENTGFFSFANLKVFGVGNEDKNNAFAEQSNKRNNKGLNKEEEQLLKSAKENLDYLLASECVYCGPSIVDSIFISFETNEAEKQSWAL